MAVTSLLAVRRPLRDRVRVAGGVLRSWEPLLWAAAAVLAALLVPIRFEIGQNSDGLLETLMSLQRLTVFFWEQDRFANLLPLLASPIADPTANAQLQLAIRVVAGLGAPLLPCALLLPGGDLRRVGRTVLLATGLALAFAPHRFIHEWLIEASPYGTSFALAGGAVCLLDRARSYGTRPQGSPAATAFRLAGLLLTIAATLVNASLVLVTGPLVALLALMRGSPVAIEFGIASVVGGIATAAVANAVPGPHTALRFGESFLGLTYYLGEFSRKPGFFPAAMLAAFAASSVVATARRWPGARDLIGNGLVLLATFAVAFVAISLNSWVVANDMHPRYLVPLYLLAASLGAISVGALVDGLVRSAALRSRLALCLCLAVLLMAGQRSLPLVPPDDGIVDIAFRRTAASAAREVARLELDGVAGDYWTVWPAVFLAEQRAHDLGQPPGRVFGATLRGRARRAALQTRLLAQGTLAFLCLDRPAAACQVLVEDVVGWPLAAAGPLVGRSIVGGHEFLVVRFTAAETDAPVTE